ncbi:MAG: hypothetical protein JWO86_4444 [Myxococcaceae bacterium]|jgi:hypothetical protein|nr:hypothetical protein [Myxococcaceae bacterium]
MTRPARALSRAEAEQLVASIHATLDVGASDWSVKPEHTRPFSLGWIVTVGPADGSGFGLGPYFVTHGGDVFASGSAHPSEKYAEDVAVMMRAAWNPLRYVRYLARRLFDGRLPWRVR